MSEDRKREKLAKEVARLLDKTYTSRKVLAEDAGISYGALRIALAPGTAARAAALPEYLPKLAEALEGRSEELRSVAEELRRLGKTQSSEEV